MVAVIALVALTILMWAVAVWTTFEDEPDEPIRKEEEKSTDRPAETRKVA